MNAAIAIAKHLKVNHWQVTRVEKWPKVFFAVVKGLGARFVSKKVIMAIQKVDPKSLEIKEIKLQFEECKEVPDLEGCSLVYEGKIRLFINGKKTTACLHRVQVPSPGVDYPLLGFRTATGKTIKEAAEVLGVGHKSDQLSHAASRCWDTRNSVVFKV